MLLSRAYKPLPEIMIPLVVNVREIRLISEMIDRGIQEGAARPTGVRAL